MIIFIFPGKQYLFIIGCCRRSMSCNWNATDSKNILKRNYMMKTEITLKKEFIYNILHLYNRLNLTQLSCLLHIKEAEVNETIKSLLSQNQRHKLFSRRIATKAS